MVQIAQRNRTELKSFFVANSIPTEGNFADLIDAQLNQKDDGLIKLPGEPLSIQASGDETSQQKLLSFYADFNDAQPQWSFGLKPRADPQDPNSGKPGFGVIDPDGKNRLFIDRQTGNVGISTTTPAEPLEVKTRIKTGELLLGNWPKGPGYVFFGNGALDQTKAGNYALLQKSEAPNRGFTYLNSPQQVHIRVGNADKLVVGENDLQVKKKLWCQLGFQIGTGTSQLTNLKIGRVSKTGGRLAGQGFTSKRDGKGKYVINFSKPFPSTPAVFVSCTDDNDDNTVSAYATKSQLKVTIYDTGNDKATYEDAAFSFMAISFTNS